jgi:hypothetical protein
MLEKKRDSKTGLAEATPHYHGHRERLRQRFREAGTDALSDYELLELLLFRAQPRGDLKPLAKTLLEKFGSFTEVISAPESGLTISTADQSGLISTLRNLTTPLSSVTPLPCWSAMRPEANLSDLAPSTVFCPLRITVNVSPFAMIS